MLICYRVHHDQKFQWRINGVDIPGAISETYAVPSAGEDDVGTYTCMVANLAGSVVWGRRIFCCSRE